MSFINCLIASPNFVASALILPLRSNFSVSLRLTRTVSSGSSSPSFPHEHSTPFHFPCSSPVSSTRFSVLFPFAFSAKSASAPDRSHGIIASLTFIGCLRPAP
ncbi:hypothetical protein TRVL_08199 [Trypanosoma vivax]|nr:hypothetical protein TRVL_08199 [Trypanosoma vivax]